MLIIWCCNDYSIMAQFFGLHNEKVDFGFCDCLNTIVSKIQLTSDIYALSHISGVTYLSRFFLAKAAINNRIIFPSPEREATDGF